MGDVRSDAGDVTARTRPRTERRRASDFVAVIGLWKWAIGVAGVPLSLLAAWPLVSTVAGRTTRVDVNVAIAFSVSVTVAWAITGGAYRNKVKQTRRLTNRCRELETDCGSTTSALRLAEQKVSSLETDIEAVRGDLATARSLLPVVGRVAHDQDTTGTTGGAG